MIAKNQHCRVFNHGVFSTDRDAIRWDARPREAFGDRELQNAPIDSFTAIRHFETGPQLLIAWFPVH
jgi:hypothetical protein